MSKIIRYSLILLSLLLVALLAAPFFIDVNTYKGQIEQKVEDATGRQLSIGNIKASLFPWVGVELDNVHLANRAGFSQHDFLSVERLHVKLALLPLLSKQVEIKHFEIVSPILYLERHKNGESNWGDLVAAPTSKTNTASTQHSANKSTRVASSNSQTAPAAPALAALQAESLSLTGGKVTWVDAAAAPVVLSQLDIALNDVQLERPVSIRIAGQLSGNAFALDAQVGPIGDPASLDINALPLQGQFKADKIQLKPFRAMIKDWPEQLGDIATAAIQVSAKLEQRPDGIRLSDGEFNLNAAHALGLNWKIEMPSADQMKINRMTLAVDGKELIDGNGSLKQLSTHPTFNMRIDSQPIERRWLETFVPELKAMYAAHPAPWKQVQFNALLAGGNTKLNIRNLQLKLDNELLKTSGNITYAGPDIRLRMSAKELHLDAWLPQGKDNKTAQINTQHFSLINEAIAASNTQDETAEPDLRFLKNWKVASQLKIDTLFMRGLEMGDFSVSINGNKGHFKLQPLSFKLAGGKVKEKASLNVTTYPARWTESVHISRVQAGPLLKTLADFDMLEGSMDMDTKFHASGLTPKAVNTLNGRGTVLFRDGKLKGFDIAGAIRKYTNPSAYKAGPQETDFAQLSGSFDVKNGIANNQDLFLASPLLRVTGKGRINLVAKTLDYKVKPRVVGTLQGQGSSFLRPGLSIPLHIYGPFESPKIKPIINAKTLIQNAPALLNKGAHNIGGSLGKLLGGGNRTKPATPSSQPQAQPESPQKQLLKGLGGLIPGF